MYLRFMIAWYEIQLFNELNVDCVFHSYFFSTNCLEKFFLCVVSYKLQLFGHYETLGPYLFLKNFAER